MIKIKLNIRYAIFLIMLFSFVMSAVVQGDTSATLEVEAKTFLNTLEQIETATDGAAKEMFELANAIGPLIDRIRQAELDITELKKFRVILNQMRDVVRFRDCAASERRG